jgi:SAM-dependent methyltransferase
MSMDSGAPEGDAGAVRAAVRERYGRRALAVTAAEPCGAAGCCGAPGADPITSDLYDAGQTAEVPAGALAASLGCGNPTALADLRPGDVVLDLGSGGGIDVLLSARRVGPTGFAYGVDMTDEMLALAERNREAAGARNVRFLRGTIESVPLPDASVDVVLSNCVINLSTDKPRVLREAFRVLRPGGRFAVSDVVVQGVFPPGLRKDVESRAGCLAGALGEAEYRQLLTDAGFVDVTVDVTRVHDTGRLASSECCGGGASAPPPPGAGVADGRLVSAFVRARKPGAAS